MAARQYTGNNYTVDGVIHYPYVDLDDTGLQVSEGEDLALADVSGNEYGNFTPGTQMYPSVGYAIDQGLPVPNVQGDRAIAPDGSIKVTNGQTLPQLLQKLYTSPGFVNNQPSQVNPLGTGLSMYWADNAPANPRPGETVTRSMNEIRYYSPQTGWRTESVPLNDPTYGPDGRIRDTNQLAAVNSPVRYQGNVQGTPYADLAEYFLRSDTPTGITTEPIPQAMRDLLQRAVQAGVIQQVGGTGSVGGQAGGGAAGGAGSAAGGPGMTPYEKLLSDNAAAQAANQAAELAYRTALLQGQSDDRALRAAAQAWQQAFSEKQFAYQQSQDSRQYDLSAAGLTGQFNGAPTLQARNQEFNQGIQAGQLTGTYNGAPTLAAQTARDSTAMQLLGLGAQLQGPSNYLTYLRTLGNTPNGLVDLVNGLAGRFNIAPSAGATPGASYERNSVGNLVQNLANPGRAGSFDLSGLGLPSGTQWNARNVQALQASPTQWGLTKNLYNESGRSFDEEYANFLKSLPKYQGARAGQLSMSGM